MEKFIVNFIRQLRRGGMKVSLSEAEDALKGLAAFGIEDPHTVYTLLRASLLKNEEGKDVFDLVWRINFENKPVFQTTVSSKPCDGQHSGEPGTSGMNGTAQHFYGLLRNRNGAEAAEEIEEQLQQLTLKELSAKELAEQLKISLGWFMADYALNANDDEEGLALLCDLEEYMARCCEKKVIEARGDDGMTEELQAKDITAKDFSGLDEAQVKAMERRLERLGKKLAGQYSYRLRPSKKGIPDMRRTMGETARRGHLPSSLPRLNKIKNRCDLLVLCDISGSMGIYSSFCLQLVYAMHRRFNSIHSFLFIDSIVETTPEFHHKTAAEAINAAMEAAYPKRTGRNKNHCTTTGISDYGKALEVFNKKFSGLLTAKTTVIIVGDAKNNWFPPRAEELKSISQRCQKMLWLNPEPKSRWNTQDSVVTAYLPYLTEMVECNKLIQLEKTTKLL